MEPISEQVPSAFMVLDLEEPEEPLSLSEICDEEEEPTLPVIFKQEEQPQILSSCNLEEKPLLGLLPELKAEVVLESTVKLPTVKIMQSARRSALPLRVHQLWDGIQHSGGANSMDLEKLYSVVASLHKLPKDEINHELEKAIKDGLIISEVETQRHEETETYRLPDVDDFEKGDHDWYCFECHLGGNVVLCEDCPRVFHLDCLANDRKPEKDLFICPVCHIKSTKPSVEKLNVKQKQLNVLLEYICDRFKEWQVPLLEHADGKTWAQAANRAAKDAWRYGLLVHMPMDMTTIVEKAKGAKYTSLEEFQVDCQTLVHGIAVYFGVELLKGSGIGASFMREALHDIQEIKLCHDCFRRSNEKDHPWWFCLPCATPHEVVWAKQSGYPFWPAKVMKKEGTKYDVRYFGGNYERGMIDEKNIQPIEVSTTTLRIRKTANWNEAYDELQKFQEIAENPDAVNNLPAHRKSGSLNKSKGKRSGANVSAEEVATTKKSRNTDSPSTKKTPVPRKTGNRATATTSATSVAQTNGTTAPTKKTSAASKSSATIPARRDSGSKTNSTTPRQTAAPMSPPVARSKTSNKEDDSSENLDSEDLSFLNELEIVDSLNGEVYFSDEDKNELQEKVSEDAVSSSCTESKSTRNTYTQVSHPFSVELLREKVIRYMASLKERHAVEISQNKKKQWCYNCEREAIYHCCWNTAYCSIDCQQQHWGKEHKRLCRRDLEGNNDDGKNLVAHDVTKPHNIVKCCVFDVDEKVTQRVTMIKWTRDLQNQQLKSTSTILDISTPDYANKGVRFGGKTFL